MRSDEDFLGQIERHPADRLLRLAYADWLEERGDPRAGLVRAEEELRRVAVWSDRFWGLKPRRDALRSLARPEWLARLRYGTECEPVFRGIAVPEGAKERWRLIRAFADRWHRKSLPDVGGRRIEIDEVERRLGRPLPESMREWVAFVADLWDQDVGCVPALPESKWTIRDLPGADSTAFFHQRLHEGFTAFSSVRHADFALEDPPVSAFVDDVSDVGEQRFLPWPEENQGAVRLSEFAFRLLLSRLPFFARWGNHVELLDELRAALTAGGLLASRFGATEVFEADNVVLDLDQFGSYGEGTAFLSMRWWKEVRPESLPALLWAADGGGQFGRIFGPPGG